jgi:tetratricopeptide (TPR) repeat protein
LESDNSTEAITAVERFWGRRLPEMFRTLYAQYPRPFLAPCEFYPLPAIAAGMGRCSGAPPQFMPFGRAVGDEGVYGFYISPETASGQWPVMYRDDEEQYLKPISSCFERFLNYCVLVGRYETEDQGAGSSDNGNALSTDMDEQIEIGQFLKLNRDVLFGALPGNDTGLYERLACLDPMDAASVCHLGCVRRAYGDAEADERALDFFHRAIEAAPWFGDSTYLLADTYRIKGQLSRACEGYWAVLHKLMPLCTRSYEWDLGDDHPQGDIVEVAADALRQFERHTTEEMRQSELWKVAVEEDAYDPDLREKYALKLLREGDHLAAERELINTLSLTALEGGKQHRRVYQALISLYESQDRRHEAALASFDAALPLA